jgi:hypothetical protein
MARSAYLEGRLAFRQKEDGMSCSEIDACRCEEWWKGWRQEKAWAARKLHHNKTIDPGSLHLVARALLESVTFDPEHPEYTAREKTIEAFCLARMHIPAGPFLSGPSVSGCHMSIFVELSDGTRLARRLGA